MGERLHLCAGKINLGNAMRTFDKKRERGRAGEAALREKNWEEERGPKREPKTFFPDIATTEGMCGTLVESVPGRGRLYWASHAWPPFCGYAHDGQRRRRRRRR